MGISTTSRAALLRLALCQLPAGSRSLLWLVFTSSPSPSRTTRRSRERLTLSWASSLRRRYFQGEAAERAEERPPRDDCCARRANGAAGFRNGNLRAAQGDRG